MMSTSIKRGSVIVTLLVMAILLIVPFNALALENIELPNGTIPENTIISGIAAPDVMVSIKITDSKNEIVYFNGMRAGADGGYSFNADLRDNVLPLDITVTYQNTVETAQIKAANGSGYTITVNNPTGGRITTSPANEAAAGERVSLSIALDSGYSLTSWDVKDGNGQKVDASNDNFIMPESNVTVSAVLTGSSNKVLASIRTAAQTDVNDTVEYIVSLRSMKKVAMVDLEFEVDGRILAGNSYEVLNGFEKLPNSGDVNWDGLGEGMWKGTVSVFYPNGITSEAPVDIAKFDYNSLELGDATMKLTKVTVSGLSESGQSAVLESAIETAEATTSIVEVIVYSKYDLNKDGKVDGLDMVVLVFYYQYNDTEARWDTEVTVYDSHGGPITASMCDVNGDGEINLLDMLDLLLNYTTD